MERFSNLRECGEVLIAQFPILRERGDKSYAFDQDGKPLTFVLVPNVFLPYVSQIFLDDGDPGLASEAADFLERMARSNWELCDLFSLEVAPHLLCDEALLRAFWPLAGPTTKRLLNDVAVVRFPDTYLPEKNVVTRKD